MLDFRAERHNLGGNPMRKRADERSIRLDEAWRRSLDRAVLDTFERIAGRLNRGFGYEG